VKALGPVAGKVGREALPLLRGVHLDALVRVLEGLCNKLGQARKGARTKDHVDVGDVLSHALAIALRDATAHGDDPPARRRRWHAHGSRGLAVEALIGVLSHAARHEADDVSLVWR